MNFSATAPVLLAVLVAVVAGVEVAAPFAPALHAWWFALIVMLPGAFTLVVGVRAILKRSESRGPIALACLGGSLLAACVAYAAFLVGQPARVPAAPGQTYRPPNAGGVSIVFPSIGAPATAGILWPNTVTVADAFGVSQARPGDTVRTGAFVLRVDSGPIAHVDVRDATGRPVTLTQPNGPAFLSPYLVFAGLDGDKPEDYFAVPALHRNVQVDYWSGLPERGIDVPFLVLRIAEENGGSLFEGVAVSGRPLKKAGTELTFTLGAYPVVFASSAPPLIPFWAGIAMVAAGSIAHLITRATRGT